MPEFTVSHWPIVTSGDGYVALKETAVQRHTHRISTLLSSILYLNRHYPKLGLCISLCVYECLYFQLNENGINLKYSYLFYSLNVSVR